MSDKLPDTDFVTSQRTFLHDIASPISVSQGMIEIVLEGMKAKSPESVKEIERLEKALLAIQKISGLIEKNRTLITAVSK